MWFIKIILVMSMLALSVQSNAQHSKESLRNMLEQGFANKLKSGNAAIYFHGVAKLKNPKDIFSIPVQKMDKGNYYLVDGNKLEMRMPGVKSISDGKTIVVVDEVSKMMYVDVVHKRVKGKDGKAPDVKAMFAQNFGKGELSYEKEETINGRKCHKIKYNFNKDNRHVYYWVDAQVNDLILMAESNRDMYQVYWFDRITNVPKKHKFKVNLPEEEMTAYHGYEVIDQRKANSKNNLGQQ